MAGFSLHGAQSVAAKDREGLERLCRYGLRPPFAQERLVLRDDGCVLYHLRRPWPHPQGPTCLVLEPLDLSSSQQLPRDRARNTTDALLEARSPP